jgi:hypothetical protein
MFCSPLNFIIILGIFNVYGLWLVLGKFNRKPAAAR